MAKVGSLWLKGSTGKLAGTTLYKGADGNTYQREIVTPSNPKTVAQNIQRVVMSTVGAAYRTMKEICDHSFEGVLVVITGKLFGGNASVDRHSAKLVNLVNRSIPGVCRPAEDDVDDDGGADEGCDGIEGDDAEGAREETKDVAQEGNDGSGEHGGGHQETVVVGVEQQACNMWHGESDECHGAAEGGDDGGEQSGDDE